MYISRKWNDSTSIKHAIFTQSTQYMEKGGYEYPEQVSDLICLEEKCLWLYNTRGLDEILYYCPSFLVATVLSFMIDCSCQGWGKM